MSKDSNYITAIGYGLAATAATMVVASAFGGKKRMAASLVGIGNSPQGQMGFAPAETVWVDPLSIAQEDCGHGTFYIGTRGDILLGVGVKSIAWRAVLQAAKDIGVSHPESFAQDVVRRVSYASLVCGAPFNSKHLTRDVGRNEFRNLSGFGLNLKSKPLLWLPVIDLELLEATGTVCPGRWDEDDSSGMEIPPECRK